MEPPVLFRNNRVATLIVSSLCCLLMTCSNKPVIQVNENDAALQQRGQLLYYHDEPFTGNSYRLFSNGKPARKTAYRNGLQDGLLQSWYPNGAREQLRYFTAGQKTGVHRGWWPNGRAKFEYFFENDEHNGTAKEWFSDGILYRYFHYNMGHEEGLEQMWWADGTVRANYIVKNGQQYGLIGRKLCRNVAAPKTKGILK